MGVTICHIRSQQMLRIVLLCLILLCLTWYATELKWTDYLMMSSSFSSSKSHTNHLDILHVHAEGCCDTVVYPIGKLRKDTMQSVGSDSISLVFSAYHDERNPDWVKIVGACYKNHIYYCQLWYKDGSGTKMTVNITRATVSYKESPNRRYSCCFINCPIPDIRSPFAVSIVVNNQCLPADNLLEVTFIAKKTYTRNFTICLSPLHSNFSDVHGLVQWIEFNRILGADNFLIYNFSSAQNIQPVLQYYSNLGIVKVLQWSLPTVFVNGRAVPSIGVYYYGQTSAFNDCLLRSKADSKFVVITDMDEFLVPHKDGDFTWVDMLKHVPEAEAYYFRHCFFHRANDVNNSTNGAAGKNTITVLQDLTRDEYILPFGPRNKYIVKTSKVKYVKTHVAFGIEPYKVDPSIGLLHHYRRTIPIQEVGVSRVQDDTVVKKYDRDLAQRVAEVLPVI